MHRKLRKRLKHLLKILTPQIVKIVLAQKIRRLQISKPRKRLPKRKLIKRVQTCMPKWLKQPKRKQKLPWLPQIK